ncbi:MULTISPECIES: Hsp70 family protein [Myxococcus]|uniref:Molecular chaperone DnaK n=1 Tax=Myxococcus xanthus TaxID=34 RepID=A0AAE6KQP1_MYXXA|nr:MULTISPECIES: Hsp70 family protein [Myxococcus]QDE66295.1 molecular chaperone DnaK [Myxococcus xanthus]QDE73568.1 molecular chaperone DnaK [Myxococcus xanthus]QDE80840.1 molecular chaperone DnaK [Myxococcus xanthus]QDE95162.1 molecular chaperone DnaK [Myxococcus xanthus]WAM27377.1 Hsp70 family protein [Myxococcus sp. NMCA1]
MRACGLDFGTSNTAAALPDGTVLSLQPHTSEARLFRSVLFFPDDEQDIYAGANAIQRYLEDNTGRFIQSVKSFLHSSSFRATQVKGRTYTIEELVAVLLRRVRDAAANSMGGAPEAVVLGRPAVFTPDPEADALAQQRLLRAAELAGFQHVQFLIEPIAAALAYEAQLTRDELVLVADFGAGTTDLTLMRLGPSRRGNPDRRQDVVGSTGVRIGGDRFDAEIMRHKLLPRFGAGSTYQVRGFSDKRLPIPQHIMAKLLTWHEMSFIREKSTQELLETMLNTSDRKAEIQALYDLVMDNLGYRLFRAIEAAKVRLSQEDTATVDFEEARITLHEPITREEFDTFSQPLLNELDQCTAGLLEKHAEAKDIDAVFLTGGSSQIPAVRQLYVRRFGEGRVRTADAFTSVAEGLGRAAAHLSV